MTMCMSQTACVLARRLMPMSYCLSPVHIMINMDCTREDSLFWYL